MINCLFQNVSGDIGGAIYLNASNAIIRLCTIVYNRGLDYGDMDGIIKSVEGQYRDEERPDQPLHHWTQRIDHGGVLRRGDASSWGDDLFGCEAEYSCIENGDGGDNNIRGNPLFVTGPLGDFYLSQTRSGAAYEPMR